MVTRCSRSQRSLFQSTPLTRGETDGLEAVLLDLTFQSTPLTRGETVMMDKAAKRKAFQSTPLTRGETQRRVRRVCPRRISIHSPHTRGDHGKGASPRSPPNFNPLPSHEGRRASVDQWKIKKPFQSTPLTRGETYIAALNAVNRYIFQSTPLTRGETSLSLRYSHKSVISIHSPHTRGDLADLFT